MISCSSNTAARSPEMKEKKHYKCQAKYTKQILLRAMHGLTHCVHILVASIHKLNVIGTLICDPLPYPPKIPNVMMPTVKCDQILPSNSSCRIGSKTSLNSSHGQCMKQMTVVGSPGSAWNEVFPLVWNRGVKGQSSLMSLSLSLAASSASAPDESRYVQTSS